MARSRSYDWARSTRKAAYNDAVRSTNQTSEKWRPTSPLPRQHAYISRRRGPSGWSYTYAQHAGSQRARLGGSGSFGDRVNVETWKSPMGGTRGVTISRGGWHPASKQVVHAYTPGKMSIGRVARLLARKV